MYLVIPSIGTRNHYQEVHKFNQLKHILREKEARSVNSSAQTLQYPIDQPASPKNRLTAKFKVETAQALIKIFLNQRFTWVLAEAQGFEPWVCQEPFFIDY